MVGTPQMSPVALLLLLGQAASPPVRQLRLTCEWPRPWKWPNSCMNTPSERLKLKPDVLVKGSDWAHYVSGHDLVEANGGRVVLAEMVAGRSSTELIQKIVAACGGPQDGTRGRSS